MPLPAAARAYASQRPHIYPQRLVENSLLLFKSAAVVGVDLLDELVLLPGVEIQIRSNESGDLTVHSRTHLFLLVRVFEVATYVAVGGLHRFGNLPATCTLTLKFSERVAHPHTLLYG
jgi:hypothetical protein